MHRRSQLTSHQPLTFVRKRTLVIGLLLAAALLLTAWQNGGIRFLTGQRTINAAAAPAHVTLYVKVVGKKQGTFKGDGLTSRAHLDQMLASAFDYGLISPRDLATGQASGKRQHKPVVITKEWGPSMPQFLAAAATNVGAHQSDDGVLGHRREGHATRPFCRDADGRERLGGQAAVGQ